METRTRKAAASRKRGHPKAILFEKAIDHTEVAAILLDKLEQLMVASPEMAMNFATQEDTDPQQLGSQLALICTPEELQELFASGDFGQGFLLGMFFTQANLAELQALEEGEAT
jgi:hypothetical protein